MTEGNPYVVNLDLRADEFTLIYIALVSMRQCDVWDEDTAQALKVYDRVMAKFKATNLVPDFEMVAAE
jgi:hypothetical protein